MSGILVGCDVGGTFTDAVALDRDAGRRSTAKAPTTPASIPDGVAAAIEQALAGLDAGPADVDQVLHGTTTATNALLEGDLAPTALVTNEGFEDVLEIGRQDRPALYDLDETRPDPVVPRGRRYGIGARMAADGSVLEPVDEGEVDRVAERLAGSPAQAVAVCLLHAHRSGELEGEVARRLVERLSDDVRVVTSHETSPEFREVERFTTTVVNAALRPRMERYLSELTDRLAAEGLDAPVSVLDSAGALVDPVEAARLPVRAALSGPAGGVAALDRMAEATGVGSLLGVDMGGTSTDVSLVLDGEPSKRWTTEVAGRRLQIPAVDVHTVGAGGGSIAWVDEAGGLRVGPDSAGAQPGPACYARGGTEPTLTDANLLLGRIPPGARLGGELELDVERARAAVEEVADRAGQDPTKTAQAIVEIATARAVRGIRVLAARHAADPDRLALAAFGGAGPQFGAEWADRMGIGHVLLPQHAGVTSAAGLLAAPPRVERSRSVLLRLDETGADELVERSRPLEDQAREALAVPATTVEISASARYVGQSHELTVPFGDEPTDLRARFDRAHEDHHGYALEDTPVEVVTVRVRAEGEPAMVERPRKAPEPRPAPDPATETSTWFQGVGERVETAIRDADELEPGHRFEGPAIVRAADTTALVPPGWTATVSALGHLALRLGEGSA